MTFQLSGKVLQITFFVAFRIAFRSVHVTFAVHHFVISPVDDRSACYAYLEYFGVAEQQGSGHVASEAPSVYTDAVSVYVGEGFQKFNAFHLVFAFFDAEAAEGGVFEFQSTVGTAAVVEGEHDIAFVSHIDIPSAGAVQPTTGDELCVRAAVYVDDDRILFVRVEICGFGEAVV